jgi:predicted RNase H-like HicB family nuclease
LLCSTFGAKTEIQENAMRYAIVIEKGPTSYGAYVPDLPGCVAVGRTAAEARKRIAKAVPLHLQGLREDGLPILEPATECEYLEV